MEIAGRSSTINIMSYHYGHLAAHCIESILSQTQRPEKVCFFDDGGLDCSHLPDVYPMVDFTLRRSNIGIIENFNDALRQTSTEYVLFLGADNWLRSDAVELLMNKRSDIVTYDIKVTGEFKSEIINRHGDEVICKKGDICWRRNGRHHGSMMYKTEIGKRYGYSRRPGIASKHTEEDLQMWNRMIADGASVEYIPEALLFYRRHSNNFLKYAGMQSR